MGDFKPCDGCGKPTTSRCYAYVGNFNCGCPCCSECQHDYSQKLWLTHNRKDAVKAEQK